jgi:hypothetical protein
VDGHETETTEVNDADTLLSVHTPLAGSVEVSTSPVPLPTVATHKETDGHEIDVSPLIVSPVTSLHDDWPPVGLVE